MPVPVSKQNELIAEVNKFLSWAPTFASPDSFWFKRVEFQARKLLSINPEEGHCVLANLYGAAGNIEDAMRELDIVQRYSTNAVHWLNRAVILSNSGFFSQAQASFATGAAPEYGHFLERLNLGLTIGAVHKLAEFSVRARALKIEAKKEEHRRIERTVALMDEFAIDDKYLGKILDIGGTIMREERILFVGSSAEIIPGDQDSLEHFLAINFRLPVSNARAAELDLELGHRLWDEIPDMPFEVMLHFESGLPLNERFPERAALSS